MSARRLARAVLALLFVLTGILTLAGTPAQALVTHHYIPGISAAFDAGVPVEGPHGEKVPAPGPLSLIASSMALDSGHLWIAELYLVKEHAEGYRIDEFDASTGAFISQLGHTETASYGEYGIAIGHATGEAAVYVGEMAGEKPQVAVFNESGASKATWTGAGTPAGSFGTRVGDVAVDNSTSALDEDKGDVYVTVPSQGVIDVFRPEADGSEHYVGQITGASASEPFGEGLSRIAVDDSNGDLVVKDDNVFDILEPGALGEYVLVHQITGTPNGPFINAALFNLTVDGGTGEIYLTEGFNPVTVDQFSSTGAYLGRWTGTDTSIEQIDDVYSLAVDPESHDVYVGDTGDGAGGAAMDVFGPDVVTPDVATESPSNVRPTSATLNGTVNPENAGYATCRFQWGTSRFFEEGPALCEPEAVGSGASPVAVHATLSGLAPDTTYYYRLQATNANGTNAGEPSQDQEFTTPGPGIHDESVTQLAGTSATFDASIDPHGAPASYYFQYGTTSAYGTDVPAPPGEAIGSGESDVDVSPHHVQGLLAGTLYHYRVVVISEPNPGEFETYDGPDRVFTTQTAAVSELPDGRQWEMVTPPDKQGAAIRPISETGVLRAAAAGDAFTYLANLPTETEPQGFAFAAPALATRGPAGWESRDIGVPHLGGITRLTGGHEYHLFSEDLAQAVVQPIGNFVPGLSPEASEQTTFLRTLRGSCSGSCYLPLVAGKPGYADVPAGTIFGEQPCGYFSCVPEFEGATPDLGHVVLHSRVALVLDAGSEQLYEWSNGELAPVSVLPDGSPAEGARLGEEGNGARNAISRDGSRVIWTTSGGSRSLYMRDLALGKTVQLDAAEPGCLGEGKCKSGGGQFQIASADGSKVFFTDAQRLTSDASISGTDLYECEMVVTAGEPGCALSDLTPGRGSEDGEVLGGVLGASEDGSFLYFVADGVFAHGAVHGTCSSGPTAGECNLYVRHDGSTELVAILSGEDVHDWSFDLMGLSARVSPDGNWVEFMSQRSVTGYDNRDAVNDKPDAEVYLYDANTKRVVCASCDPTGARPVGAEYYLLEPGSGGLTGGPRGVWETTAWVAANVPGWQHYEVGGQAVEQPRYLSDSGRLFFNSGDALVPQDVDGTEDVYEYEPPGVGSCTGASATFSARSDGCVGLISAGTSAEESAFMDASESGGDVFILTYSKLQPQDYDNARDVYDAHECTSSVPCFPAVVPQPPTCTTAEACRAAPTPQPTAFGAPSSATFAGAGNVASASGGVVAGRSLTRSQKLARALRDCARKRKKRQATCQRRARARYGPAKPGGAVSKRKGKR